jgi:hypothetical protein
MVHYSQQRVLAAKLIMPSSFMMLPALLRISDPATVPGFYQRGLIWLQNYFVCFLWTVSFI